MVFYVCMNSVSVSRASKADICNLVCDFEEVTHIPYFVVFDECGKVVSQVDYHKDCIHGNMVYPANEKDCSDESENTQIGKLTKDFVEKTLFKYPSLPPPFVFGVPPWYTYSKDDSNSQHAYFVNCDGELGFNFNPSEIRDFNRSFETEYTNQRENANQKKKTELV